MVLRVTADASTPSPLRIAIVVPTAYPAIHPQAEGGIGGQETRAWLYARGLGRDPRFDVHFFVRHRQAPLSQQRDGVTVRNLGDFRDWVVDAVWSSLIFVRQWPWLMIRRWRWSLLWQAPVWCVLRAVYGPLTESMLNPPRGWPEESFDVVVMFGVSRLSAQVLRATTNTRTPSLLMLVSMTDVSAAASTDDQFVSTYGEPAAAYRIVYELAERIVAQTAEQEAVVNATWRRSVHRLPNPIDLDDWDRRLATLPVPPQLQSMPRFVLWIGRADRIVKRPQLALEAARRTPDLAWVLVMNHDDDAFEREILASLPPNVRVVERVPPEEMPAWFRQSCAYVSTGRADHEGFPNVFLQAAASGKPIVSLEVAPEWIERSGAGVCLHGDVDAIPEAVQRAATTAHDGSTARAVLRDRHSVGACVSQLGEWIRTAARRDAPSP